MLFLKKIKLVALLMLASIVMYGQDPYYTTIDANKGLPSNFIYNIFQDSKGFMWFATNDGICKYDGFEFKSYSNTQQTSKAGSLIKEDKYGRIWYENFDGYLYYIENDKLHKLNHKTPQGYIDYALIDDRLIFLHKAGIDVIQLSDFKVIRSVKMNLISMTFSMQIGNQFILLMDGIKKINKNGDLEQLEIKHLLTQIPAEYRGMAALFNKKAFLINNKSNDVYCFSLEEKDIQTKFKIKTDFFIQNLCNAGNKLWFCSTKGVICCDTSGAFIGPPDGWMKNTNVNCVFQSADKSYWIGTAGQGLLLVRDIETRTYLPNAALTRIEKKGNDLLLGTKNDEILVFNPAKSEAQVLIKNTSNHPIDFLKYDFENDILYYTSMKFNSQSKSANFFKSYDVSVKDMVVLDNKFVAVAASGVVGIKQYNSEGKSNFDSLYNATYDLSNHSEIGNILTGVRGKSVAKFENENAFYCATNIGLYKIETKGAREIKVNTEAAYFGKIKAKIGQLVALGTNGLLWSMNQAGQFKCIDSTGNIKNIFLSDSLLCLYRGGFVDFCLLKGNGFVKLEYSYPISSEQVYDIKLLDNNIYIATDCGLLKVNSNELNKKSVTPLFYINSIKVRDSIYNNMNNLSLNSFENDVEISYSVLDFKNVEQHKIEYSINEGVWKELASNTRTLRLSALAGGRYEVKFKVDGTLVANAQINFSIAIPWWKQIWFVVTCFIFVCTTIVVYYRWQTNVLKKKNLLLVQKIELEKNLNQSILTSIKAQMNPHFFYNALNTIQSYIFTDDKRNATNYLSKFSKLTRIILEMSEKETVALSEEISALTLYLDLEKVRFSNDFEYAITVKDNINIELIKIPSMIIQPFVENAIKHGLLHKKGNKELSITFTKRENSLEVLIIDNGVGRKKSAQLNKIRSDKHQSFSTTANTKRLEILNNGLNKKLGIEIIDNYDGNEQATGTSVNIQIPI